jgi:hypothetical protein
VGNSYGAVGSDAEAGAGAGAWALTCAWSEAAREPHGRIDTGGKSAGLPPLYQALKKSRIIKPAPFSP